MSFPASVRGSGTSIGFPDVCNTPAGTAVVPTPYTNTGNHSMAQGASETVKILGMSALTTASTLSATQGDEAGTAMGTTSGTVSSTGTFTSGSPTVYIDGIPAVRLTSTTTGNNMNNSVGSVTVPGAATVLFGFSEGTGRHVLDRALDAAEAARLFDAVERTDAIDAAVRGNVALVRIARFTTDGARRFFVALRGLARPATGGIVVDLRSCDGGDLEAALALAGEFVPAGTPLLVLEDADGDEETRRAPTNGWIHEPVTLLVGPETKSAAEAFVMALSSCGRARVVGGPTFGKHSAQAIVEGGARVATVLRFRAPS